ncbi:hypothetical protein AFK62_17720 [Cronobacter condimenti 1330]|uniref:Uncharacterized protein n=1 Tax=Cronobacter condimenti 1330 TaxID=1073999 RepID=A0ABM5VGC4_9ENTR|nr:hypothetical protein [Cronobacter condimenti]ALB64228.1 hypothetical protein AFK62_17720 [Cronobacter condimenti 1330]
MLNASLNPASGGVFYGAARWQGQRAGPAKTTQQKQRAAAGRATTALFPCFIVNSYNMPWLIKVKRHSVTQNTTKEANSYLSSVMPLTLYLSASKRLISTRWDLRLALG